MSQGGVQPRDGHAATDWAGASANGVAMLSGSGMDGGTVSGVLADMADSILPPPSTP